MSFNVTIPGANTFIGIVAEVTRKDIAIEVESSMLRTQFWSQYMLPKLTEEFISSVMKSEARAILFSLPIPGFEDVKHVIAFQHFAHLNTPTLRATLIPWQLRVEIASPLRRLILSPYELEKKLAEKVFNKAGWKFYGTDTGFIIYPSVMFDEMSDTSAVFTAWMHTRELGCPTTKEARAQLSVDPDMPRLESLGGE